MAADSDGARCLTKSSTLATLDDGTESVTTVVTCEGDYYDPDFPTKFQVTLGQLENILCENQYRNQTNVKNSPCRTWCKHSEHATNCDCCVRCCVRKKSSTSIKVAKLEPWNSVRVTLSVPREAAARLRQLASEGSTQLRQLGILSVQVEGDQVISLRLASRFGNETDDSTVQEIVLNATNEPSTSEASTSNAINPLTRFLQSAAGQSTSTLTTPSQAPENVPPGKRTNEFRSPNVVCPSDTQVPIKPGTSTSSGSSRPEALHRPFPFASMQQAAIAIQNRSHQDIHARTTSQQVNGASPTATFSQPPPPPYPVNKIPNATIHQSSGQNIAISSPLLVNLLQNEGAAATVQSQKFDNKLKTIKNNMPSTLSSVPSSQTNNITTAVTTASSPKPSDHRVPPLPQVAQHLTATYGSTQPKVVQNVQSIPVVTTTSSTVPSHNLKRNTNKLYMHLASTQANTVASPPTLVTTSPSPTTPTNVNPRLQQTQQLRNLQQQLLQQQQTRLLNQKVVPPPNLQQRLGSTRVTTMQQQPPPYPTNRPVATLPTTAPSPTPATQDFTQRLQARSFSSYPTTNVPDNLIPFGQPMTSNLQPIAQPMPHLGHIDSSLSNITPSLTDLSKTDLDSLLPSLTDLTGADLINDIASDIVGAGGLVPDEVATAPPQPATTVPTQSQQSPPRSEPLEIPDELTSKGKKRLFLINPLSGLLEPMPSESSESESDSDESKKSKKEITDVFSELNDHSNSFYSDDDTCSTTISSSRRGLDGNTDQSDSETTNKSSTSESSSIKSHRSKSGSIKVRRDSPNLMKITTGKTPATKDNQPNEKIKLRLKLEKNEPINTAYKVDVSFVNRQEPKRANTTPNVAAPGGSLAKPNFSLTTAFNTLTTTTTTNTLATSLSFGMSPTHAGGEEPRVPPLHISLRGRNSVVISNKNSKKHNQKSSDDPLVTPPSGDVLEDKMLKRLKIRMNKERDVIKIKNRLIHKSNHINHDSKTSDGQSNATIDNESGVNTTVYHNDSKDLSSWKSVEKKMAKKAQNAAVTASMGAMLKSSELIQQLSANQSVTENLVETLLKNHKKVRTVDLLSKVSSVKSKSNDKVKKDKSASAEYDNGGSLVADDGGKKNELVVDSLKRPHSSPTMNTITTATTTSSSPMIESMASSEPTATVLNGILHSPDVKKRKLSTSILEMNNTKTTVKSLTPPPPSTPMHSVVGSTNTGTLTTTVLNHTTSTTNTTASASVLTSKLSYTKASSAPAKVRRDKDKHSLDSSESVNQNDSSRTSSSEKSTSQRSKSKDLNRDKTYSKLIAEKRQIIESKSKAAIDAISIKSEQIQKNKMNLLGLPTAGELDMEAKFKQRLMEDSKPDLEKSKTINSKLYTETNKSNILNKTSMVVLNRVNESILQNRLLTNDIDFQEMDMTHKSLQDHLEDSLRKLLQHNESEVEDRIEPETLNEDINLAQILADSEGLTETACKSNSGELIKYNAATIVQEEGTALPQQTAQQPPNRSPTLSNSAAQGEDSGIESMDALSEKSPNNQASQSPHSHNEIITNLVETLSGGKDNDKFTNSSKEHASSNEMPSTSLKESKKPCNDLTELGDIEAELAKMEGYGQNGDNTDCVLQLNQNVSESTSNTDELKGELETNCIAEHPADSKDLVVEHLKDIDEKKMMEFELKDEKEIKLEASENVALVKDLNENKEKASGITDDCCTVKEEVNQKYKTDEKFLDLNKSEVKVEQDVKQDVDSVTPKVESPVISAENDDFDPLPMRRTPPLYTYSNPDKQIARNDSDSPLLDLSDLDDATDSDINSEELNDILALDPKISTISSTKQSRKRRTTGATRTFPPTSDISIESVKQKSLLEQLLIEIPQSNEFSEKTSVSSMSHSPAISEKSLTKTSVRTRSSSKLNSPDISQETPKHNLRTPKHSPSVLLKNESNASRANSPATNNSHRASPKITQKFPTTSSTKRKRRESESSTQSTQSVEETPSQHSHTANTRNSKKLRKCSENAVELIKVCMGVDGNSTVANPPTPKPNATTKPVKLTKPIKTKSKSNSVEESSDSDEPLIEIKVRNNSSTTNNSLTKPIATRNKSVKATPTPKAATVADDIQKPVISTRRSVRNNLTQVSNSGGAASVSNAVGQGVNAVTTTVGGLKTRSTKAVVVTSSVSTPLVTCTTNATAAIVSTPGAGENTAETATPSTNRRKTRSAVTETLQEKRTRRNSKDSK